MNLVQEALNEMRRQDGTEIVSERIIDRARGNLAGAGAAGKWLWNRVSGKKDQNQAGFRETTRNSRFSGMIKSHAKVVHDLLGEINQFIAQQAEQGKDTSELEKISGGISDFFAKNEKIFGMGLGDADAEDYKNQELPTQQQEQPEQPEQPAQSKQPEQSASPEQPEQPAQPASPEQSAQPEQSSSPEQFEQPEQSVPSRQSGQSVQSGPSIQPRPQWQMQQPPARKKKSGVWTNDNVWLMPARKKKSGVWTNDNVWLNARNESTALNCLYDQILLDESNDEYNSPVHTISSLYNKILISEAQQQPKQQMPPEVNNAIAQVYSKLGDLADQGSEEDKDFVYQLIQKMAQGTPMQEILKELEARGNQEKQQAQQQSQESVTEGISDMRRKFYARQAGKEAAKAGGDRKAAQQEAYDNRIFEFQTRLDRALGELSLDLKTMGYKQQGGDADRLILAFRKAVSQFSKSKKEEGETSWLQRRRHGLGHALATSATYAALRAVCPATILGNKYFARGLYGAATSVIRDVSRGNLNKKSILRALAGAGIAVGATIGGEMLNPSINTAYNKELYSVNGDMYGKETVSTNPANIGTRIRSWFDKDLRGKFGTNTTEFGNPEVAQQYGKTAFGVGGDPTVRIDRGTLDVSDPSKWQDGGVVNMNGNQIHVFKAPDGSTIRVNPHQIQAAGGDPMKAAIGQFSDKVQNGDVDMDKLFPSRATNMVDSVDTGVKKVKSLISDGSIDPDDKLVSLKGDNGRSYFYNKDLDEVYASDGSQVSLKTAVGQEIKNKAGDMDGVAAKDFGSGETTYAGRASAASAPSVTPPSNAMPDNVKDALGYTDEGELDLEQASRISKVDTSNIKRRPGESLQKWLARKKLAEIKGTRDQLLKAGYGKTTVTPTGTRTTLNGRIVGGQFIPN